MALRIGFDLDGVLADMEGGTGPPGGNPVRRTDDPPRRASGPRRIRPMPCASRLTPRRIRRRLPKARPNNVPPLLKLKMTPRQQRRLWRHVESIENFWESLAQLEPGVIERLARLTRERRWEIIFLTKRPEDRRRDRAAPDPALARITRLQTAQRVRRAGIARSHRGRARARHRRRRSSGKLPRCRRRLEGARDPDLARRARTSCRRPPSASGSAS